MSLHTARHGLRSLCVSAAAVAALAACGGGGGSAPPASSTPSPPPPASPTPPAPTPPAPSPSGTVTYYFSDCATGYTATCSAGDVGNNSNAGTSAASPKRDMSGFNVNALPAGAQLLFRRGGAWSWRTLRLDSRLSTRDNPYVFDAYGSGANPLLQVTTSTASPNYGFEFSEWGGTVVHGGYVFRNLTLDGVETGTHAFFLRGAVNGVVIEGVTITRFAIGINAQGDGPIRNVTLRNSNVVHNTSMGMLGGYNDSLIEGNLFEDNNYVSGSGFNHGTYLSGHGAGVSNLVVRNNRYLRNSVSGGRCTGGNMTFHGRLNNVLIEGNTIEQDAGYTNPLDQAASGCWLMSITQGYDAAVGVEGFTNFVVRNNRLINGGNTAIAATSAPGILIEGNTFINQQGTAQTAVHVGSVDYGGTEVGYYANGDMLDSAPVVRNNTACTPAAPNPNSRVAQFSGPVAGTPVAPSNTQVVGSTGACAR